jgi:hypothetical protein
MRVRVIRLGGALGLKWQDIKLGTGRVVQELLAWAVLSGDERLLHEQVTSDDVQPAANVERGPDAARR